MPTFTPPTRYEKSDHPFFGRYRGTPTGISVVKVSGTFIEQPYPWLGDIAGLIEGTEWFQGGRTYWVTTAVADELTANGFTVDSLVGGYGDGEYGDEGYGGSDAS